MYPYFPIQQVIRVNGENGAKAYQMSANSSVLLLDESAPVVWLKSTDGAGYPSLTCYDITPHIEIQEPSFSDLESRLKRLEEIINEQSNNSSINKRTKSNGAGNGNQISSPE